MPRPFLGKYILEKKIITSFTAKRNTSLTHYTQERAALQAPRKAVRRYARCWPGWSSVSLLTTWHCSQAPGGADAFTASSQNPQYLLHDQKRCDYVHAILPTLGSKNAKPGE